MSSDDDDDVTAQAFAGFKGHVDGYKSYMNKLKKGARSGISQSFGNAADLLPPEHLTQYKRVDRPLEVGQALLKEGADPNLLRQTVEQMVLMANAGGAELQSQDGREIIAVLFEDGKKMFMYDDYSVEPAPEPSLPVAPLVVAEPVPSATLQSPVTTQAVILPSPVPAPVQSSTQITSPFSYTGPATPPLQPPPPPLQQATATPLPTSTALLASAQPAPSPLPLAAPSMPEPQPIPATSTPTAHNGSTSADLNVTTINGSWLWDVTMDGEDVALIITADGTAIQKADDNKYVVTGALKPGQRVPQVEIVADVIVDQATGNIYYQNTSGTQAVALLNNGWRIDQFKQDGRDDQYFVTEPVRGGQPAPNRQQVASLTIDPESGEIRYDTIDGGATMTLKCRKLS